MKNDDEGLRRSRAEFRLMRGNLVGAIEDRIEVNRSSPSSAGHEAIGKIKLRNGDPKGAIAEFRSALALERNRDSSLELLLDAAKVAGDAAPDANDIPKLIKRPKASVEATAMRAALYRYLGQAKLELAERSRLIDLDKTNSQSYGDRAAAHMRAGRNADAVADFSKAISLTADAGYSYLSRARLHLTAGDAGKALADAVAASRTEWLIVEAALLQREALDDLGKEGEARALLERHFDERTPSVDVDDLIDRARIGNALGRHADALQDVDKAIRFDSLAAYWLTIRAEALEGLGRHDDAKKQYESVLALEPANEAAKSAMTRINASVR